MLVDIWVVLDKFLQGSPTGRDAITKRIPRVAHIHQGFFDSPRRQQE